MFVLQVMSAAMEFVPLVCLSLVTWSGITSADGPTVVQQVVKEDRDAVLSCSFGENAEGKVFEWRKDGDTDVFLHESDGQPIPGPPFKDRVSHFPDALQSGNASIVIRGTKVSDSGNYTCDFPTERPMRRSTISLTVGAAPRPFITTLGLTERGVLLQCKVLGASPKPDVKWQDSDGTVLQAEEPQVTQRDGKYDVTLNIFVTKSDTFSCISTQEDIHHQIGAQTSVYPFEPTVVQQVVEEDGDAVLSCSFGENAEGKGFDWRKDGNTDVFLHESDGRPRPGPSFQGRVSHFPDALQSGNASIVIRGTKVSDIGIYTCDFPSERPMTRSTISLTVGAAPEPSIMILEQTENGVLLRCLVRGAFPKPRVKWQDSDGTVLQAEEPQVTQRDGKYDVILKIVVTKSDNFSCISTQKDIHHQSRAQTFIHPFGAVKPEIKTLEETNEWSLLQCEIRGVSPKTKLQWKDSFQNVVPAKDPEVRERGGSYDIILQTTVTKSDYYHCVATQEETGLQTEEKTHVNIGGFPYGWVLGPILGFAFLGVIICLLKYKGFIHFNKKGGSKKQQDIATLQESESKDVTAAEAAGGLLNADSSGSV